MSPSRSNRINDIAGVRSFRLTSKFSANSFRNIIMTSHNQREMHCRRGVAHLHPGWCACPVYNKEEKCGHVPNRKRSIKKFACRDASLLISYSNNIQIRALPSRTRERERVRGRGDGDGKWPTDRKRPGFVKVQFTTVVGKEWCLIKPP